MMMKTFVQVEEARAIILDAVKMNSEMEVDLDEALGFTLSRPIVSTDDIPPFPNSGMDGYAVRAEDFTSLPVRLAVVGEVPAGAVYDKEIERGTCVKIMTGAPVPDSAEAVVPVEWTRTRGADQIIIERAPQVGGNIRAAGQDVRAGERIFEPGRVVFPPVSGMLATLGYGRVMVRKPPRFAVVATGDELLEPGEPLQPGKIRNSSGTALRAQVLDAGGVVNEALHARDNKSSIRAVVEKAMKADALIFAGGVSVGDYDLVKDVLDEMGMNLLFWKVKQRPGKPLAFGLLENKPVFGLPGNPVSSAICFEQYVRPAIAKILGRKQLVRDLHPAVLAQNTPKVKGLHFFARGIATYGEDGRLSVRDTGPQASNLYSSMVRANCIFHIEEDVEEAPAGTPVKLEWLPWSFS